MSSEIAPEFPFPSHFVEIQGSKLHYIDEGQGDPVLFLHGNPTSSYLWRNIIPHISPVARAIAPDLIGMGRSDKPDISYRFFDHYRYIEGFIEALNLENVTLVIHDWGSALGFHYACRNEANIKGIAFMEAIWRPLTWKGFPGKFKVGFKLFRAPLIGWFLIVVLNAFVRQILPQTIVRKLGDEEMARYAEPYPTWRSRRPLRRWPCEIPIDGHPADVHHVVSSYHEWLLATAIPKLFCFATPGAIIPANDASRLGEQFKNIRVVDIGKGKHFIQEDEPHRIGSELAEWYTHLL